MKKAKIMNLVCIAVMAVVVVVQFMPFWYYEGTSTSLQMYVWFPEKCKSLTKLLQDILGKDYAVGNIVLGPIALLVTPVVGIVLSIIKKDEYLMKLIPLVGGVVGAWGYLTQPALQLGSNWVLHLVLSIVMAVVSCATLVMEILALKKKK